jgi:hypothetical protein
MAKLEQKSHEIFDTFFFFVKTPIFCSKCGGVCRRSSRASIETYTEFIKGDLKFSLMQSFCIEERGTYKNCSGTLAHRP